MIGIHFNKQRAEHFIESLANGEAIMAPPGGWTGHEMLALAGACWAVTHTQGPALYPGRASDRLPLEHRELVLEQFLNDEHAAISFYEMLTTRVMFGDYDVDFAPEVQAMVTQDLVAPARTFVPGKGCRWDSPEN